MTERDEIRQAFAAVSDEYDADIYLFLLSGNR